MEEHYWNGMVFQQDGAPVHIARHTKKFFYDGRDGWNGLNSSLIRHELYLELLGHFFALGVRWWSIIWHSSGPLRSVKLQMGKIEYGRVSEAHCVDAETIVVFILQVEWSYGVLVPYIGL